LRSFIYRLVCGIFIGFGSVLPGVSGGILAISLGIYEKMMLAIGNFFRSLKANIKYLLPLVIGGGVGILLTSNVLDMIFVKYEAQMLSLFTGLVLGSLPELYGEVTLGGQKIKWKHVIAAALGLAFVLLFALGESSVAKGTTVSKLTIPGALTAGLVLSFGTVIPGISSSFILVYMGLYPAVISTIAGVLDLSTLAEHGLGAAIAQLGDTIVPFLVLAASFGVVSLLIIKLVNRMLARHHSASYAAVIGFVIGSVVIILPSINAKFTWACPVFFVAGLALSYLEFRFKEKMTGQKPAAAITENISAESTEK
jgi:putative membrane protein